MIVCHCNKISSGDIDCAVNCLMKNCENPDLCPDAVYGELNKCAKCCGCFPLAEQMIQESALQFIAKAEIPNAKSLLGSQL